MKYPWPRVAAWGGHALAVVLLTALSQVGGVIYLVALVARRLLPVAMRRSVIVLIAIFGLLYGASWPAVAYTATLWGRTSLPCSGEGNLRVALPQLFCLLHRQYVSRPALRSLTLLADTMSARFPGTVTQTLDANFPFFDGFPLLPHLSHDDGNKVDLAFYYARVDGTYAAGATASPFGYWAFVPPTNDDFVSCRDPSWPTLRWDMDWLQPFMRRDLIADEARNRAFFEWVVSERRVSRVLVEPHVALGLGFEDSAIIGFQGCRAARHDDHIHLQF